jgi:hypothetical protein
MIEYGEVGKMWTESANSPTIKRHTVQIGADMIQYTTETQSTMTHFKVLLQNVSGGIKGTMKNVSTASLNIKN